MKKLIHSLAEIRAQLFIGKLILALILVLSAIGQASAQLPHTSPLDVSNLSFTPSVIDTTADSQVVSVTIRVTDVVSDVASVYVKFYSLSGNQFVTVSMNGQNRISGDGRDGVYRGEAIFPKNSKSGMWHIFEIIAFDSLNYKNFYSSDIAARGFPIELKVISLDEDAILPQVIDFSFTPSIIDLTDGSQTVTVTARATDAQAAIRFVSVDFQRAGDDYLYAVTLSRISGDDKDGIYQGVITFPQNTGLGTYGASVDVYDALGNSKYIHTQELAKLGFTAELQVIKRAAIPQLAPKLRKRTRLVL